jgi:hypothetical protein
MPRVNKTAVPPKLIPHVDGMTPIEAKKFTLSQFHILQEVTMRLAAKHLPQDIVAALQKIGFGFRTRNNLLKKLSRATRAN